MAAVRTPNGHELFDHSDEDEALQQPGLASLLMQRLDDAVMEAGKLEGLAGGARFRIDVRSLIDARIPGTPRA